MENLKSQGHGHKWRLGWECFVFLCLKGSFNIFKYFFTTLFSPHTPNPSC